MRATLDDAGAATAIASYDPWGVPQGGLIAPFGFMGELQDATNGIVHLRARWYDTSAGRFAARDPFAGLPTQPLSQQYYQYAYNDPILWSDPSGELAIFTIGGWWEDDPDNPKPSNGIYRKLNEFVIEGIIPGDAVYADTSDNVLQLAERIADVSKQTCGDEPIILLGQSRGAAHVMDILYWAQPLYPEVQVDLVVTMGMVPMLQIGEYDSKYANTKRHINIRSEVGAYHPGSTEFTAGKIIPERLVSGSEEWVIAGTNHHTLDDVTIIYEGKEYPNPAWELVREAIVSIGRK
ncbi:YD repeat-containing protein [Oscillochloris trichoides DG-6]|uniref:YD repeat-containing protein n=1 Tax=Oscillochloris trichoides DG-6 TaxID=765420 RepID=E1I9M1_9CHLR|nr:RHS repeat-associated core domain-containing protein [Oscillochloris trichoides]EFO82099.1 YD repeat-containing protein [Oscillochloris trichoides DG-6]